MASSIVSPINSKPITPNAEETPGKSAGLSLDSISDSDENQESKNYPQKIRKMQRAVTSILKKTKETKENLKELRQEVEITCEEIKNETIEVNVQNQVDLSENSEGGHREILEQVKCLEEMLQVLREKVKIGEEVIRNRSLKGDEIKELIFELQQLHRGREVNKKTCGCSCLII